MISLIEIGVDSFAAAFDEASLSVSAPDRLQNLVEQIVRADQVGLDVFGIGEHHRREMLDSAPAVVPPSNPSHCSGSALRTMTRSSQRSSNFY